MTHSSLAIVAASVLSLFVSGCRAAEGDAAAAPSPPSPGEHAVAVRLAATEHGPVPRPIHGTGVVRLKSEADLSFKVGGVIASLLVEEGATVRRGQVLARLDPIEVDAAVRQAREGATKADRDRDRVQALYDHGALPVATLDDAKTQAELSHAALDAARFNALRSQIIAPDDGRIDKRFAETGEIASPGRPIFHMSGRSRGAVVKIGLSDRDALRIHEGDAAHVVLDARPETTLDGVVSQIATVASPLSGTFDVEIRLAQAPADLLSGLTAKVTVPHDEPVAAVVPLSAIVDGKGSDAFVFVLDGDHAKKEAVKVAFLFDTRAALSSASLPEQVVSDGAFDLKDGEKVRVVP